MQADWMRQCSGFILVYSIISKESFMDVDSFQSNIMSIKNEGDSKVPVPMVLAANKCDLENHREVSPDEGMEKAKRWGCQFFECSAKSNKNVQEVFAACVKRIVELTETNAKHGGGGGKRRTPCVLL
jgi:GTPase KRas